MRKLVACSVTLVAVLVALAVLVYRVHTRQLIPLAATRPAAAVVGSFHVHSELSHDSKLSLAEL